MCSSFSTSRAAPLGDVAHLNVSENATAMLQKCANPKCTTPYKYFREGRLYEFQVTPDSGCQSESVSTMSSRRELFWLCDVCAASHALIGCGLCDFNQNTHQWRDVGRCQNFTA